MTEIKSNAVIQPRRLISAALLGCEGRLNPNSEAGMGERPRPACAFGRRARTLVNTLDALSKSPPAEGSGPANAILAQIPVGRVPSRGIGLGFESTPLFREFPARKSLRDEVFGATPKTTRRRRALPGTRQRVRLRFQNSD